MPYKFSADESVPEALSRCALEQLDRATRELTVGVEKDPVAAVHAARKSIKKERALLRLARGTLPRAQRRQENAALRQAARRVAAVRDAEVLTQTLDQLAQRFSGQLPARTFKAARAQLELLSEAERTSRSAVAENAAEDLRAVRTRVDGWRIQEDGWGAIEPGLARTYKDGRKAMRRARKEPSFENLHAWRKRVKDLWYELRLLAPVCGPTARGQAAEAKLLSELLGSDHDLGLLRQALEHRATGIAADLDSLIELLEYRRQQLQMQAFLAAERLYGEKPGAFIRRMHRCWGAGRRERRAFEDRHPAKLAQTTRAPA